LDHRINPSPPTVRGRKSCGTTNRNDGRLFFLAAAQTHDSHPRITKKTTHFGRWHEAGKPIRVAQLTFEFSHALIETRFLGLEKC